jgi:tRNA (cmo5U34)-methyltransferase
MSMVGDAIAAGNAGWTFAGKASSFFDSHVSKSVPFYADCHDLICKIADFHLGSGSLCYDLGMSTGTLLLKLTESTCGRGTTFIGIDNEPDMVEEARKKLAAMDNVEIICAEIVGAELNPADLIIACYTVQFIKPKYRQFVINAIYNSLNWGGAFLLFEKVRAPDARFQDMMTQLYVDFKVDQGYNGDEIVGKTRSLKGVMEPFSTNGNLDLLRRAGFVDVMTVYKYVTFEGFLAIK